MTAPTEPSAPVPARFNIARYCLEANAEAWPDKAALIVRSAGGRTKSWSFAEFLDATRRLAAGLDALGLAPRARVAIRLAGSGDFALAFFAVLAAGRIAVPTSEMLTPAELRALVADARASLLIVGDDTGIGDPPEGCRIVDASAFARLKAHPAPARRADTGADDPAFLVYTSGTGGRPKGVLHAHRAAWGRRPMIAGWTGIRSGDRVLHAGRLNWTYTLGVGLIDPWSVGATAMLYDGPREPGVWLPLIESLGATIFVAVPSLYRRILKYDRPADHDLARLRHAITAGEPLRPDLLARWRDATGVELYEALGMSEISTYVSSGPATPVRPGSPGRPQPGRRVAILPLEGGETPLPAGRIGLLAVDRSDPGLMLGYWGASEREAAVYRGEWFVGGDLALIDEDGYVWFHGRNDEVMNAFGYRVSPLEVEAVLAAHPGVAEAAVAEIEVAEGVRVIAAFIVAREAGALAAEEIRAWCAKRLAAYKRPRELRFVSALPHSATGKLLRRRLAETGEGGTRFTEN